MSEALDRAVAEKIMGNMEPSVQSMPEKRNGWIVSQGRDSVPPAYSTDANLTYQVIAELQKRFGIEVRYPFEGEHKLPICFLREAGARIAASAEANTWNRAVCLAALLARGHSTEGL